MGGDLAPEAPVLGAIDAVKAYGAEITLVGRGEEILKVMKEVYLKLYGTEPKVMAIHAGLECGILSGAYPNWDMISCGPTLLSPHSPDERAYIPSVAKVWEYLQEVLKNIPECR